MSLAAPTMPPAVAAFWGAFAAAAGGVDVRRFYSAFAFGDSEALADELAALVLAGVKRATAGLEWAYLAEGGRTVAPGDLSIVTSGAGRPLCVIETTQVDVLPFNEVGEAFAALEGEGDGSLAFWREAHRAYFSRECLRAGRVFDEAMAVVCECFRVVYAPAGAGSAQGLAPT